MGVVVEDRKLTDADVEAIAEALENRMATNLYKSLGQGFVGLFRKAIVLCFGGVILYGMSKGIKP